MLEPNTEMLTSKDLYCDRAIYIDNTLNYSFDSKNTNS